ncbi:hypothetical protein B1987_15405 [Mycobacterium kansasii]|uniref:Uncharacterized protein n=1 Tax=Mycobacterium attenuatum TaxID=2341086 RepID=A0A498PKB8_9MYCO|nr:hypothetical protein [Mycobacterium attenuatum]ORB84946.1 hypothetical protein B1987_15405 [Mycobacterium kansasii]VBA31971.1 hypothetical protein LAUMK136_00167 [Mycobacterium attenuatum]VBA44902.1 hypothetical protein LAUMK191_00151 [Mycobacterium attenuatum]VBA45772.1 hypothetical protein LAUMK41_00206 [Mycobacterium attenuatum]
MTTMTTNLTATHRVTQMPGGRWRSVLRAGRRLPGKLRAPFAMTAQQRTDAYLARMPIAMITNPR